MKAVLFDAAGVLTAPFSFDLVAEAITSGADVDTLVEVLLPIFSGEGADDDAVRVGNQLERGEVSLEDFLDSLGEARRDAAMVIDPHSPTFFGRYWSPNIAMAEFVHEVHEAGFLTGLVSNNVREWQDTWDRLVPTTLPFDVRLFSWQVGARKPEPAIYERALRGLDIAATDALFIDDFAVMADGARSLGMTAIDFVDEESAIAEARQLLGLAPGVG